MPETIDAGGKVEREAQNWAMLCHLTALSLFIGVPFGNLLGPLVIWLLKRGEYPLVEQHGKESLNFQISMTIYGLISGVLIFAVVGFVLVPVVIIADIGLTIFASVKVANGEPYRYPLTIRLLQ